MMPDPQIHEEVVAVAEALMGGGGGSSPPSDGMDEIQENMSTIIVFDVCLQHQNSCDQNTIGAKAG